MGMIYFPILMSYVLDCYYDDLKSRESNLNYSTIVATILIPVFLEKNWLLVRIVNPDKNCLLNSVIGRDIEFGV